MPPAQPPAVLPSVVNTLGSRLWPAFRVKTQLEVGRPCLAAPALEQQRCAFKRRLLSPSAPPIFILVRAFSPKDKAAALRVPCGRPAKLLYKVASGVCVPIPSRIAQYNWILALGRGRKVGYRGCQSEGFFAPLNHLPPAMSSFFSFFFLAFLEKIRFLNSF